MKLDCDMCVMTMPDLEKYHIKRSRVRKDIEYVYTFHGIGGLSTYRKGAFDWFDTIFCPTPDLYEGIRASEKLYGTPEKLIVQTGYPLIDSMIHDYGSIKHSKNETPQIMIAPSWQPENIIELCAEKLIDELSRCSYKVILRPHPQQVRHEPERFEALKEKYEGISNIEIQTDFSVTNPVMESDLLITDWSDIAWDEAVQPKIFEFLGTLGYGYDDMTKQKWQELYRFNSLAVKSKEYAECTEFVKQGKPVDIAGCSAELISKYAAYVADDYRDKILDEKPLFLNDAHIAATVQQMNEAGYSKELAKL